MKLLRIAVFFLIIILSTSAFAGECRVTILHFNDFHGQIDVPKKSLGGAERIAAIVAGIDQENLAAGRHTLLFNGGDLISGTPVSEKFKGEAEFKFLEAIGTEAMVIGNHDFDFGIDALKENMKKFDIPVLSANITDKTTGRLFTNATYVFPLGPGCRVGVMGLTSPGTPKTTTGDLKTLSFSDPVKTASNYIDDLVDQSEIRVALTHLGVKGDVRLVQGVKGFNIVIGGHDDVKKDEYCRMAGGIPVCQTPSKGKYIGRIDLVSRNGKVMVENTELIRVDKKAGKNKHVRNLMKPYVERSSLAMQDVVTTLNRDLGHRPKSGKVYQVALGLVVADAMKKYTKADVAFMNTGGMRKTLKKGKVTRNDVFEALPFDNYVGTVGLTGGDLIKIVKMTEKNANPERPQPFLNWSGLKYKKLDGTYEVFVGNKVVDRNKTYKVATVDFLANGGDGYTVLKEKDFKTSGKVLRDVVERYLKSSR